MAAQSFHCVLCEKDFPSVDHFNNHEKEEPHRREFERRMDNTNVGLLLCKCCFISVSSLKEWNEHIKSKSHVKLVTQSEYLGKRCVWSVPGVKMKDGSIKLCKDLSQLRDCGWRDPDYVQKVATQALLETDLIIGMNCITLKSMSNDLPVYHCALCCVDFHHNDRNHAIGRQHRINVIWNWEKKTADRIAKGLDFPKPATRAKAQAELEEVTKKIFKMEQDCLNADQFDLYQVISTKKLPCDLGKGKKQLPAPLMPPRSAKPSEPDQIINVRSRTPSEPPAKKPREADLAPKIQEHQAISIPPPMPPPSDARESDEDEIPPEIRAEIELFDLMEELQLSGNFKPEELTKSSDPTKLLNMLFTLGEGLMEYQTKKREIPMELPREEIKEITKSISSIEEMIKKLGGEDERKESEANTSSSSEVPVTS